MVEYKTDAWKVVSDGGYENASLVLLTCLNRKDSLGKTQQGQKLQEFIIICTASTWPTDFFINDWE
jgi:hypothetical protein